MEQCMFSRSKGNGVSSISSRRMTDVAVWIFLLSAACCASPAWAQSGLESLRNWKHEIMTDRKEYYPKEPIWITLRVTNISTSTLTYPFSVRPYHTIFALQKESGERREFGLYLNTSERKKLTEFQERARVMDNSEWRPTLAPGKHYDICAEHFVIGLRALDANHKRVTVGFDFLLKEPGKYCITRPPDAIYPDAKAEITILPFDDKRQEEAAALWTPAAAVLYHGEDDPALTKESVGNLKKLIQNHNAYYYTPYARIAMAQYLWGPEENGFKKRREFTVAEYNAYLEPIILGPRAADHPALGKALDMMSRTPQGREMPKVAELAAQLALERPGSPYIGKLKMHGLFIEPGKAAPVKPAFAVEKNAKRPEIKIEGLEKVPQGPREVFEADKLLWAAESSKWSPDAPELDENAATSATLHLASDYMGDRGGAYGRRSHWEWIARNINVHSVKIEVEGAEMISQYKRPLAERGPDKAWTGEICLIRFYAGGELTERRTGETKKERSPINTTALIKRDGKWLILSETTDDPTGRRAESLKKLGLKPSQ